MSRNKRSVLTILLVMVALVGGAAATVFYIQQKEFELVPGLLDDGNKARDRSTTALAKNDFKAARGFLIDARTAYDQVLKIDPENSDAKKGSDDVSERFSKALLAEHDFEQRASRQQRFKERLEEVSAFVKQVQKDRQEKKKIESSHPAFLRALNMIDLLLEEDPANAEVLKLKAEIALHMVERALEEKELAYAEFLLNVGLSTGLNKDDFSLLKERINTEKLRR